jgi:DNA-binding LytR/AlgR family response regulator
VDYLLKPVEEEDLKRAIEKARGIADKKSGSAIDFEELVRSLANPQGASKYKERFLVSLRHQWVPVHTRDIACFVKETLNYIVLFDGTRYQLDNTTLDEVEEVVDPRIFYRANRQFIIHVDAIQSVKPLENAKLTLRLKEPNHKFEIDMSREKAPGFKKWMDR